VELAPYQERSRVMMESSSWRITTISPV
jgi:hypothetical protein